jgi:hypothetical protein
MIRPRYSFRQPYKVKPHIAIRMRELRAKGKSYQVVADFCGVSRDCARKWLVGLTPRK